MKTIDVYYQGEGINGIEHLEIASNQSLTNAKILISEKHGLQDDIILFLEDCEDLLDVSEVVDTYAGQAGIKAHVHRCRHIEVSVSFASDTVHHRFGPGTTIAHVKRWAAVKEFGMTEEDAGEHVLQIAGKTDRPTPGIHIGTLTSCPNCHVAFDLVPDQRINGSGIITAEGLA